MILSTRDVESGYGDGQVLFGLDLDIPEHAVVSLLGRNGMGKTTTVRTVMGMLAVRKGAIRFGGRDIAGLRPHAIAQLGIGLVPEGRHVFGSLSVWENLVATQRSRAGSRWDLQRVFGLFPRLQERRDQSARTLSGGEQQMLAIGRALLTNPRLLILDEATEGLAPIIRREIWTCLAGLKSEGQAILLIDKNLAEMHDLVDRHNFIEKGRIVWSGTPSELDAAPGIVNRYLGL